MTKGKARPESLATSKGAAATSGGVGGGTVAFDPFTATMDEATAQPHAHAIRGPVLQWVSARMLEDWRARIEGGDGFDVLQGVAWCATNGLKIPDWLADMFLQRYRRVQQLHVSSWDDPTAFGRPYPPRVDLAVGRLRREKRIELEVFFSETRTPRTKAGFAAAAKALGITTRQARDWTPKTRRNTKGHKPYKSRREVEKVEGPSASDPFGLKHKPR